MGDRWPPHAKRRPAHSPNTRMGESSSRAVTTRTIASTWCSIRRRGRSSINSVSTVRRTARAHSSPPAWTPIVSGASRDARVRDAVLRLNTPSGRSHLAMLPGDDGPVRATFRTLFESFFDAVDARASIRVRVRTQKHRSRTGFTVSKHEKWMELPALREDRSWDRLFDEGLRRQHLICGWRRERAPRRCLRPEARQERLPGTK